MEYVLLILLGAQGYFTIFRLTPLQNTTGKAVSSLKKPFDSAIDFLETVASTVKGLDQRLSQIEAELKMRASDSARIIEWLDKRDRALVEVQEKFQKSLNLEEREKRLDHHQSEIIQLGKEIRLIRERK